MKSKKIMRKTNEVELEIDYYFDATGQCNIYIKGHGDFRHHLIEELIFALADEFEMKDHLGVVINKLKVRLDDTKTK